jgi:hypothetical protein
MQEKSAFYERGFGVHKHAGFVHERVKQVKRVNGRERVMVKKMQNVHINTPRWSESTEGKNK